MSRAGGECGRGSPPPAEEMGRVTPGNFWEIFDAKSRVWGQFWPENKLIEGQPNDVICRNASVLAFQMCAIILFCRSAVRVVFHKVWELRSLGLHRPKKSCGPLGTVSVPKIIINDNKFIFLTAICILVISNHNSFRVLFDKIAYVGYVIWKYIYSLALKTASPWTMQYCTNCRLSTHFCSLSTEAVAKQQQLQQQKHCAVTNLPASVVTSWQSTPLSVATTRACNLTSYRIM